MSDRKPILVTLDDDKEIADVVGAVAEQAGFDAKVTTSHGSFHDAIHLHNPDVIVLDLQMPEMDGIQVLRSLADKNIRAGILLVTGMDERTMAAAEQYGKSKGLLILGALQKPFMPEDLLEKLHSARSATGPLTAGDLEQAIANNQLVVYYQAIVRRFADSTWDIGSMEALLRWDHPERGILTPDAFLDMGEKSGLMGALTDFVLQRGIEQLKGWQVKRLNLGLRINIAASLINDIDFPDRLEQLLAEQELDPSALTLEITETAMLGQHPDTFDILTRLRVKNINLAIDDFGIGYSSLTQLFRMPFNEMKIDKSLMLRIPQSKEAKIMVETLVELAHKLNLTACAEGVETPEALDFLDSISCDSAQGFLISRPLAPENVPSVIDRWDRRQHEEPEQEAS